MNMATLFTFQVCFATSHRASCQHTLGPWSQSSLFNTNPTLHSSHLCLRCFVLFCFEALFADPICVCTTWCFDIAGRHYRLWCSAPSTADGPKMRPTLPRSLLRIKENWEVYKLYLMLDFRVAYMLLKSGLVFATNVTNAVEFSRIRGYS